MNYLLEKHGAPKLPTTYKTNKSLSEVNYIDQCSTKFIPINGVRKLRERTLGIQGVIKNYFERSDMVQLLKSNNLFVDIKYLL